MPRAPAVHQLDLVVPGELEDAVTDFLVEAGAGAVETREHDAGIAIRVFGTQAALRRLAKGVTPLLDELGIAGRPTVSALVDRAASWQTAFTEGLAVVRVSETLILAPSTVPALAAAPRGSRAARVIRLEPAFAFGFGDHPTTLLAARAVERRCRRGAPAVLDVGTGTGVLALVAAIAGARGVEGVDVDARAVASARRNARANGLGGVCRFSREPVARLKERFDLVVANVDFRIHAAVAADVARAVRRGGVLLVTGMLRTDASDVCRFYEEHGLRRSGRRDVLGDWALATLRAPATARATGPRGRSGKRRGKTRTTRSR